MSTFNWKTSRTLALERLVFQFDKVKGVIVIKARHEKRTPVQKAWKLVRAEYWLHKDPNETTYRTEAQLLDAVNEAVRARAKSDYE
jgi:G3E family GTPase